MLTLNANGTFSYTHDGSENFSDSFTYEVSDAVGNTDTATVTITITPVNDNTPVADNESFTVVEGGTATEADLDIGTSLLDGDTDIDLPNDTLTVNTTPVVGPSFGVLTLNANGTFSYTHDGSENFSDSFTYQVSDAVGNTDTATVTITITPVNDNTPVADAESFTVVEGGTATEADLDIGTSLLDGDTDIDLPNDTLTVNTTPIVGPSFGLLTLNANGTFSYTHDGSENFSDSFTYEVSDAVGNTDNATVNITITPVNDEEVLTVNNLLTLNEGATATIDDTLLQTNDVDNTPAQLVYTITGAPASGTVRLSGVATSSFTQADIDAGLVTYRHDGGEMTGDSFDFTVDDGAGTTSSGAFNISVTAVNDAPVANADSFSVDNDSTLVVNSPGVLANDVDVDGDPLTVTLVTAPTNGSLTMAADGSFTYTPSASFSGTDTFVYTVSDGVTSSGPSTVSILVNATLAPPPPIIEETVITGSTDDSPNEDERDDATLILIPPDTPTNGDNDAPGRAGPPVRNRRAVNFPVPFEPILIASNPVEEAVFAGFLFRPVRYEQNVANVVTGNSADGPSPASFIFEAGLLWNQLDSLADDLQNHEYFFELVAGTSIVATGAMSAGAVLWAARTSYFLTMLSTSLPAWAIVDPIPVLDAEALKRRAEKRGIRRSDKSLADIVDDREVSVTLQPLDQNLRPQGSALEAATRDISDGGIGLLCRQPIDSPYMRLQFTTPQGKDMDVIARVAHCTSDGQYHHIGTQIVAEGNQA